MNLLLLSEEVYNNVIYKYIEILSII